MKRKKFLNIRGALLDEHQLENYLEKIASEHVLQKKSDRSTYPIDRLNENFVYITKTYDLLNRHMKQGILIHPAGEWLLDNYYIIEETYKMISKELTMNKYTHFVGMADGLYQGFARIYVLASEIVGYTEGRINPDCIKDLLKAYQNKKTLNMEEIWNINLFFDIALIEKIRNIAEKISYSQMEKYKVESMIERLIDGVDHTKQLYKQQTGDMKIKESSRKETFVEYLSYRLKSYGKKGSPYLRILEKQVEKAGSNITEMIRKEHFNIALQKVFMGNCIKSIKDIQRINFTEIFEEINGVENVLKQDPSGVYEEMDHHTKAYYRNVVKELSKESKISEMYITKQALELAQKHREDENVKKSHIGYYLVSHGIQELRAALGLKVKRKVNKKNWYIGSIIFWTSLIDFMLAYPLLWATDNFYEPILLLILLYIPVSEIVIKMQQYILSKIKKPTMIPKLSFQEDIPKEYATMVVVPTILNSGNKTKKILEKLEVFYLANQSKNLYFTLLGDCTTSTRQGEPYDKEIIQVGRRLVEELNQKYPESNFPKFHFIYRKRMWNEKENCFLGWERKRGFLAQVNQYLLGGATPDFLYNSMEGMTLPKIKYVITLDGDTNLVLDSAKTLIGSMAHILNKPVIHNQKVIEGYGIIQPRIGIDIESTQQSLFTQVFAGTGGVDFYSNAISDIYQDNFKEGIYTGKGIYDLEAFHTVLKEVIPENTVLSHDLLEGLYLKCGLASDILLLDSYPSTYQNYMTRQSRWIRGDWQIIGWLRKKVCNREGKKVSNPLGELDKFKILDNLRRSLLEITQVFVAFAFLLISGLQRASVNYVAVTLFISVFIDLILDTINSVVYKQEGRKKQKYFANSMSNMKALVVRTMINFATLPHRAFVSMRAVVVTIYRICNSHKHLLEWVTAEEAEQSEQHHFTAILKRMWANEVVGALMLAISTLISNILFMAIGVVWMIAPGICYYISQKEKSDDREDISGEDIKYVTEIAERTWDYFKEYLTSDNNYLPPDNYQESRKNKLVMRTSSTNIGLAMMSIISAYDLKFITLQEAIRLLNNIINTIRKLPKWHGHLYNWYNITTLEPLKPMYISSVDSGNFTGYCMVAKAFLNQLSQDEEIGTSLEYLQELIEKTDFSKLYDPKTRLLSIGFNVEENKLTPSYYDLLASEARQASLIAIAKRDVPAEHWNYLSRTLTAMDRKKGLVSWSGTAFEYLMPNINIKKYKGSLLDESCKFMIMSQKKYCHKLGVPWGISESAFNLKDLQSNYQYKAFGIPWLGLKRGLADEVVVSSYGSLLALEDYPQEVIDNIKRLENSGMYWKYGLYEAIDYTPERVRHQDQYEIVKTYMAHHQALILLSINNYLNHGILRERFHSNPQIKAVDILLQERMPEDMIVTKEKKEMIEKIKYKGYNNYITRVIKEVDTRLNRLNVIANKSYTVCMNQDGTSFSKYKNILIHRYKETDGGFQGIQFYFKDVKTGKIWTSSYEQDNTQARCMLSDGNSNNQSYTIEFSPDQNKITKQVGNIRSIIKNMITPNENVEIRNIKLKNLSNETATLEVSSVLEPVLSTPNQDYAHKAFNNLFLKYETIENGLLLKRKLRDGKQSIYLAASLYTQEGEQGNLEYETDKQKLCGRLNRGIPNKIMYSDKFSNETGLVVDPVLSFRRTVKIPAGETVYLNLILSVGEDKLRVVHQLNQYKNFEKVEKAFEISKIRIEEEEKYLRMQGEDVETYQTLLSYLIKPNPMKSKYLHSMTQQHYYQKDLWPFGISGDRPILVAQIKEENDIYTLKELLRAYEYFMTKNIELDLVILDGEENVYEQYVKDEIERELHSMGLYYLLNHGIYLLNTNQMENIDLFLFRANVVIDTHEGKLSTILKEAEEEYLAEAKEETQTEELQWEKDFASFDLSDMKLRYQTPYGGFTEDGKEYVIAASDQVPLAWTNVLANPGFGTIVTQNLGGFTWHKNSRLNRISRWSNDSLIDTPSEAIYIKDCTNQKIWRMGEGNLLATYGFGYAKYEQRNDQIISQLDVFVPLEESVKVSKLRIKNNENKSKRLKLIYKVDTVLGEDEIKTNGNLHLKYHGEKNCVVVENLSPQEIEEKVYVYSSEKISSYTGNNKSIHWLDTKPLNGEDSLGKESCMAVEVEVTLNSYEEKEVVFALGAANTTKDISGKFSSMEYCEMQYYHTKKYWEELLGRVRVNTPAQSLNYMLNGWSMYQTIASRLFARSGFNQSGGAFGFRDQLQDCMGLEYLNSDMVKKQIIKHAAHQFVEGDVEHWWHDENHRGIRTKFSDDRLWLVYLILDYIEVTQDRTILEEKVDYLNGKPLGAEEDENYDVHEVSPIEETIYQHCIRAINISLRFGEHGLPLIGTGDWNDGFNTVGNEGKGESVWLGFFLFDILSRFQNIVKDKGDVELENQYRLATQKLKKALNQTAWDGSWYKRAFTDEGAVLGSAENAECRIDSIAQSWAVISDAGDNDKKYIAMSSLEKYLIDRDTGIIKLLDPPFENSNLEPGYIKAYLPGVRENGGQYTHAAIWTIIAFAKLGLKEKALEYFTMINPIEHANTKEKQELYKIEPYVISADIYGSKNLLRKRRLELVHRLSKLVLSLWHRIYTGNGN